MPLERCHMALRQTLDLINLTDDVLRSFPRKTFSSDELYSSVLGRILGGHGRRGPAGIFIAGDNAECLCCSGRVYRLRGEQLVEGSDLISIDPESSYAISLVRVQGGNDVVARNWRDISHSIEEFQSYFHPEVVAALEEPIENFVSCRISGGGGFLMVAFNYHGHATEYDADVLRSAAVVIGSLLAVSHEMEETEGAFKYTIEALARACEAAEPDTGRHIVRVNRYAGALAANMGYNLAFVKEMSISAQMHDVGKIRIPAEILLKQGTLTPSEMELIRQHPAYGAEILGNSPRLHVAREIALSHHENWDGTGYPKQLRGEHIPISGRIAKVADVYDALRSKRSYKGPFSHEDAVRVFREGDDRIAPEHFDPAALAAFFKIEHMFALIYDSSIPKICLDQQEC
jgi:response regulator RpfG family c-di-GMP phosphodiesterase